MNQRIDFAQLGGFGLTQNALDFMQQSYRNAFGALANFIGNYVIISGVVVNAGAGTVSDGWISYNGELMPFVGGGLSAGVTVIETGAVVPFQTGGPKTVKFTKYATCGSPAIFPFASLKIPQALRDIWCKGDVKRVHCDSAYILANFDGSGLGLNERLGWAIRNGLNGTEDARGRTSIAWDNRTIDPANGIWDIVYNTPGAVGGILHQVLTMLNIPLHDHIMHGKGPINDDASHGTPQWFLSNDNGSYAGPGGNLFGRSNGPDNTMRTGDAGQATPDGIDIRQPFIVNLEIEKL